MLLQFSVTYSHIFTGQSTETGKERFLFLLYEINAQNVFLIKIWNSLLDKILLKEVGLSK